MIVFLVYSINTLGNNLVSSTGEQDSVLISYDDLRVATSKMIELDYTIELYLSISYPFLKVINHTLCHMI